MKLLGNRIVVEEIDERADSPIYVETKERFYKAKVLATNGIEATPPLGSTVLVDREKEKAITWEGKKAVLFELEDVIAYG